MGPLNPRFHIFHQIWKILGQISSHALSKEEGRQKMSKYTLCIIHVSDAKHNGEKQSPVKRWWMMQVRASEWDRVGWEGLSALATWPQTWVRWGSKPWVHLGKGKAPFGATCTVFKERQMRGEGWAMESEKKPGRTTQGLSGHWKDSGLIMSEVWCHQRILMISLTFQKATADRSVCNRGRNRRRVWKLM